MKYHSHLTRQPAWGEYVVLVKYAHRGERHIDKFGPFTASAEADRYADTYRREHASQEVLRCSVSQVWWPIDGSLSDAEQRAESATQLLEARYLAGEDVTSEPGFNPDWCD